jgi:hypothetical protein
MRRIMLIAVLPLMLTGCLTYEDRATLDSITLRSYSRAEVDAINAAIVCRDLARNLVQIARCNR